MNQISLFITIFLIIDLAVPIVVAKTYKEKLAPQHEDSTAAPIKAKTDINFLVFPTGTPNKTKTQAPLNSNSAEKQPVDEADGVCYAEEKPPDLRVIFKEDGGGVEKANKGSLLDPEEKTKIIIDGVEREDGIAIICSAEYPVYLHFWENDSYSGYFYNAHEKCCQYPSDPKNCKVGIWFSKKPSNLSFICTPALANERAQMEKKAVISIKDTKTQVEILTTMIDKEDKRQMHGYGWVTDPDCYGALKCMFILQGIVMIMEEMMVWSGFFRVVPPQNPQNAPNGRNRLARRMHIGG
ncbi:unnamed protein product [Orchesella dallaii]|uniref:Uncharacterized protein n=1 Tax=Orchesella dallaii TaxID=48710 RepID=A0ABP1Q830_9HEXA